MCYEAGCRAMGRVTSDVLAAFSVGVDGSSVRFQANRGEYDRRPATADIRRATRRRWNRCS